MVVTQKKYICSFCARAFSRSEHRVRHERSHTGYKPFQCMLCQHSFVRRDLVQRHIKTVHKYVLLNNKTVLLNIIDSLNNTTDHIKKNNNVKNNTFVPSNFNIVEILKNLNIILERDSNHNYQDFNINSNTNTDSNFPATAVTENEPLILDKIIKFFVNYKSSINDPKSNMRKKRNKLNNNDRKLSVVNNESDNNLKPIENYNERFSNSIPNRTMISQSIPDNINVTDINNITKENENDLDRVLFMTHIDPNDIDWINYINNTIFVNLRNELPDIPIFKVSDFIMYFNYGYKFILGQKESNGNETTKTYLPPSLTPDTNNLLFIHYLTHSYKNLESLWGFNTLSNVTTTNNNNNNILTNSYNNSNMTLPILPLTIVYLGCLLNNTIDHQLWNDLWLLSLKICFYNNQIEQVITVSLLIFEFIQQYILLNERTGEYVELYSIGSPVLTQIFNNYQILLFNFVQSNVDCSLMNFNQWDFDSLILIWTSFLQLFDGKLFDDLSSKIYFEIMNKYYVWNHFSFTTLKDLIRSGINHLINEYTPNDLLVCLPSILYLEANNNGLLNRDKILTLGNFKSVEDLHNLIIKVNQCYIQNNSNNNTQFNDDLTIINGTPTLINNITRHSNETISISEEYAVSDIDTCTKNMMILVAPQRFKPIIKNYAIIPTTLSHWLLIESTWFEFTRNLSSTKYIFKKYWVLENVLNQNIFFDSKSVNNNLSICSLPIILLVIRPTTNYLNILSFKFKRFLPLIIDVLLVQLKLFSSELTQLFENNKNKSSSLLLNPIIQLLFYVWYIVIYKVDGTMKTRYSHLEVDSVNMFMSKYIMNLEKHIDTDKLLERDLEKILFDKETIEYMGFHCFSNRTAFFIENELLLNKVFSSPYLSNNVKFNVLEAIKYFKSNNNHIVTDQCNTVNSTNKYATDNITTTTNSNSNNNTITAHNNNTFNVVSTNEDHNNMASLKVNDSILLEPRPVNFNSLSVPLHSLENQHLLSPFRRRNSMRSNSNSIAKPISSGRYSFAPGSSPVSLSPYFPKRRSSVISITDDGKNYLLPPLNFDPIQMDVSNFSLFHYGSPSVTVANASTNPSMSSNVTFNDSNFYYNENLNDTTTANNNNKNSFNTL